MLRSVRRQLRGWKQEFLVVWGRLRSFHRVSLGLILAALMVFAARPYVFDPLKVQIREAREALEKAEAPETVSTPETDPESQELGLRIENLAAAQD